MRRAGSILRPRIRSIRWRVSAAISKLVARLRAAYWGLELGPDCVFFGRPMFYRAENSRIIIGEGCQFRSGKGSNYAGLNRPCMLSTLRQGAVLEIGNRSGFSGTVIAAALHVKIGDGVLCGANVTVSDTDWHNPDPSHRLDPGPTAPVVIEDNVWLGLNVVVLKGVTIGRDSVVGAGSVVTKSIPPNVIAAGNPATVIRPLSRGAA